ncbi:MAG: hypothetical protein BroJett025_09890 [Patescibacteria group bacterium]|nr:MAG: hypothetical protein BroJett025_09890 [Patescibacteria group bacterium]
MLRLKVTPVVGLPQFTGWSQVAESTVSVSVRLIVVYAISGKHAGNVGRDISEKVSDYYFYDAEQLHEFLQQLVSYAHANECKMYFACAVLGRSKSIFATYGGTIFLKRGEKSGKILSSEYEVKLVEGTYESDDVFVLTTLQADQFLSEIQLKFQQGYDVDIIITSVVPGLHAQDDSSLSALVFVNKDEDKNEVVAETKEESAPFLEVSEEDLVEEVLSDATEVDLAQVSLEVDKIQVPESVNKAADLGKHWFEVIKDKSVPFFKWLLRLLKKLLLQIWLKMRQIDFKRVADAVSQVRREGMQSLFNKRTVYVSDVSRPRKGLWKLLVAAVVTLVALGLIGVFSYQRNKEEQRIQSLLVPIQSSVSLAKEQVVTDPIVARQTIASALEQISNLEKENEQSSSKQLLAKEKEALTLYLESISGREELQELETFYDLRLAKSDFIATGIDMQNNSIIVYDKEMKQVLLLDSDTKKVRIRNFSDRSEFSGAVMQGEYIFVISNGVYKYKINLDEDTELETVREAGDSNKTASLLDAYDRFVYVVNPEKRNIYRYAETEDGYSEPVGWMKSATGIRYEDLRSMSIDGDVWLTTSDGQIKKFTSGREETLTLRGLDVAFTSDIYAYTNENLEKLYVLDPSNNRIILFNKNGDFVREIKSVSLGAASAITASESLGKIFVASGSIVYQINL